ncbi:uncharacterized protein LOC143644705 [Tamandua tetradactyla]|uniref:uncharacterized protein LOC143644705 n=1 Tax=Tamandua tetradactyla TaxID=48850 RepID=UPI0040538B86
MSSPAPTEEPGPNQSGTAVSQKCQQDEEQQAVKRYRETRRQSLLQSLRRRLSMGRPHDMWIYAEVGVRSLTYILRIRSTHKCHAFRSDNARRQSHKMDPLAQAMEKALVGLGHEWVQLLVSTSQQTTDQ